MYQWMLGVWREGGTPQGHVKTSGSDGYVHDLDCHDGFMGGYVETYETVRFKYVPFTVSRLYFNKAG